MEVKRFDESEKVKGLEKGFRVVISSIDTGDVVDEFECTALVGGACTANDKKEKTQSRGICLTNCTPIELFASINGAMASIDECKKILADDLINSFTKNL